MLSFASSGSELDYFKRLQYDSKDNTNLTKFEKDVNKNITLELARNSFDGVMNYWESLDEGSNYYHTRSNLINLKGFSTVEKLTRNPAVYSAETNFKLSVVSSKLIVKKKDNSDKSKVLEEFLELVFADMEGTITKSLYNCLSARINGYSVSELVYKNLEFKGEIKKGIRAIKAKKPGLFSFRLDEFDNIISIISLIDNKELPVSKFFIYSYLSEYSNPYGFALFDVLYPLYFAVNELQKLMILGAAKHANPSVVLSVPVGSADEVLDSLQGFSDDFKGGAVSQLPDSVKAQVLDISSRSTNPYKDLLDYFISQIEKVLLLNDLTVSQSKGGGTRAETSEKIKAGKDPLIKFIRRDLEDLIKEQIIRPLLAYNFDPKEYPLSLYPDLVFNDEAEKDKSAFVKLVNDLTDRGYMDSIKDKEFVLKEVFDNVIVKDDLEAEEIQFTKTDTRSEAEKISDEKNEDSKDLKEIKENYAEYDSFINADDSDDYIEINTDEITLHSIYDTFD